MKLLSSQAIEWFILRALCDNKIGCSTLVIKNLNNHYELKRRIEYLRRWSVILDKCQISRDSSYIC